MAVPPGRADLLIYQGDDFRQRVTFSAAGAAFDLTGYSFRAQFRHSIADADSGAPALADFEVTVTNAAGGEVELALDHAVTTGLSGRGQWDLEGTDADGLVTTFLAGGVQVAGEVTR